MTHCPALRSLGLFAFVWGTWTSGGVTPGFIQGTLTPKNARETISVETKLRAQPANPLPQPSQPPLPQAWGFGKHDGRGHGGGTGGTVELRADGVAVSNKAINFHLSLCQAPSCFCPSCAGNLWETSVWGPMPKPWNLGSHTAPIPQSLCLSSPPPSLKSAFVRALWAGW